MIDKIPSYPKIFALGNRSIETIFNDEVEITEKVDGSHFAFGKINGQLHMRSKNQQLYVENIEYDKMFSAAMQHVKKLYDSCRLPEGSVFYCEYLSRPKHNVLAYERIPKNHLALFAMYEIPSQSFVHDYMALKTASIVLDIDVIPLLDILKPTDTQDLTSYLKRESYLGKQFIEGIVVKNYNKDLLIGGQHIPLMCGKYVSASFKEVHHQTWKQCNSGKSKWEVYKEGFKTEARWNKGIQRLIESGDITYDPRDIGKLIVDIQKDVVVEEKENIKDKLWELQGSEVTRSCIQGFPEYYKRWLLERSNNGQENAST